MPENPPNSHDTADTFIVITGDPVEGFIFTGPFATHDAAEQWAEGQHEWWTAFLEKPARRESVRSEKPLLITGAPHGQTVAKTGE